ncbi:MAG: 30S ribosomal protein S17 [Chloroflexi bacterium]|nr:30S ribosomal protein S17 [Chloroflexota bacterium]
MSEQLKVRRKTRTGWVVSDKMDKTVVVAVQWRSPHPLYRKTTGRISRLKAHVEPGQCRTGDQVRIVETRPLSRTKRWRVVEVIQRKELPEEVATEPVLPQRAEMAEPTKEQPAPAELAKETAEEQPELEVAKQ